MGPRERPPTSRAVSSQSPPPPYSRPRDATPSGALLIEAPKKYGDGSPYISASSSVFRGRSGSRLATPSRPPGGGVSTSQGRSCAIFRRALERGNLLAAEAAAKGVASAQPRRRARVDDADRPQGSAPASARARWLLRCLEECNDATIDEAAMVAACLAALAGDRQRDAALRAMAERASSRRRTRGVAAPRAGSWEASWAFGSPPGP